MQDLDQAVVRKAFVNSSRSRAAAATFPTPWPPADVDEVGAGEVEVVGWVDPKAPQRAYVHVGADLVDRPTTIELRLGDAPVGGSRRTMCDWCHEQGADGGARLMVAPRAGARGRAGDTVGLYVCADFGCSRRVRVPLEAHRVSVSGAPDTRVDDLRTRVREFVERVTGVS